MEKAAVSSAPPAGTQAANATRSAAARPGAARDGDQAGGLADGFAQLLAAMGGDAAEDAGLPGPLAGAATSDTNDAKETPLPTAVVDAGALMPWMAGLQTAAMPVQAAGAAPEAGVGALVGCDAIAGRVGLGLARAGQDSLVGQTAMLDGAAEAAAINGTARDDGAAAPMGHAGPGRTPLRGAGAVQSAADPVRAPAALRTAGMQAAQAAADQVAAQTLAGVQGAVQGAGASGGMERGNPLHAVAQARPEAEPVAPALAAGSVEAGTATAAAGRPGAAPAAEGGVRGLEPPAQQGHEGAAADTTQGTADELLADQLADQLAEQVTYWVHQKTQNAELTLDQGGRPVEVKVALTGEQAHVSLRSDQPEARQLLDAGRDQLQDMLQRQGLQLAGMTVGSGGGDGARQDGREPGRQGAQRASVRAAPVDGAAQRRQGVGERGVDIFV